MVSLLAGVVVGIILFQTAALAPTIFRTLDPESAGLLLRALFPKFFRLLAALGVATVAVLWIQSPTSALRLALGGVIVVLPIICAAIIPATNRATDEGDTSRFRALHTASVVLTLLVLGAAAALPFVQP